MLPAVIFCGIMVVSLTCAVYFHGSFSFIFNMTYKGLKGFTFLISLVLFSNSLLSQKSIPIPKDKNDPTCVYKLKYSPQKRKSFYPFDAADTIKLISFRYHRKNYPFKNDSLVNDSIIETKTLSTNEIDNLTDILYNNFYKEQLNYGAFTLCFFPRNAIVFCDKYGDVKSYVLICFYCKNYEKSDDKIFLGDDCSQKIEKLRMFFIANGMKFGTNPDVDSYLGEDD